MKAKLFNEENFVSDMLLNPLYIETLFKSKESSKLMLKLFLICSNVK